MRPCNLLVPIFALTAAFPAHAQLRTTRSLTLEGAKNIAIAAEAEAKKNNWNMVISIVDAGGELLYFQKGDGTRPSNGEFALRKARTAAKFQRPTKFLDSAVTAGRIAYLSTDALPIEGGEPIVVDGMFLGAVGVSGATAAQDAQVARAGIAALKTSP